MRAMIVAGLIAFACASTAMGQVRLAEVTGTVTDESGAVLPGVTLTAIQMATGQKRVTVSETGGAYIFTAMSVGIYEFRAELQGFAPVEIRNYELAIGASTRLDIHMKVASLSETVVVTAEAPLVDPTKSTLTGRIDQRQLEQLPVNGRNWMTFATLAPGVKSDGAGQLEGGSVPLSGVGTGTMSKISLDGGNVQNLSTQSIDLEVSKEIIGQFEVITNRFDATMGHAGTTITNAVTKSGTDQLHGAAFLYYRDNTLNATDFFTGRVEPYHNRQYGGTVGGPIVRGKTHFFGSYERQQVPQTLSANTGIPALDAPVDSTIKTNLYFGRLDHQFWRNHQVSVRYNRYHTIQPNFDVGGTRTISNASTNDYLTDRVNLGFNSTLKNTLVNQFSFTFLHSWRQFNNSLGAPPPFLPSLPPANGFTYSFPSLMIGPCTNVGNERPHFLHLRDDVSYFFEKGGRHNLKVGGEYNHEYIHGIFANNANGTFFFSQDPANLASCCPGIDETAWDRSRFPIPTRYSQALGDYTYYAPNNILGAYVQDDWTISPRLTLNLGLRYDLEAGSLANNQTGLVVQSHGNDATDFAPRVGFAWDVSGSGKTIIRGGGGIYYDQVYLNLTFNQIRTNTGQQVVVTTFNTANEPNFINNPLGGLTFDDFKKTAGAASVTRIAPDARQPRVITESIGVSRQLGSDLAISADFVAQASNSILQTWDENLFCCLPDGNAKPINSGTYPELGGFVAGAGRPDPRFQAITTYHFLGKSRYNGLQVNFTKRMSHRYQFAVNYLLSKNKDSGSPNNVFNIADDFGRSSLDERHHLVANWLAELPKAIQFSGIVYYGAGRAIGTTTGGIDINGDAQTGGDRPTCGVDPRFTAACTLLGIANGQRIPRNPLTSSSVFRVDARISRKFTVGRWSFDPGIDAFNLFNRQNNDPRAYNTALTSPRFGLPGRSSFLAYQPRQIQLSVRTTF